MKTIIINGYIRCKKNKQWGYYEELEIEREESQFSKDNLPKLIAEMLKDYKCEPSAKQRVDTVEAGLEESKHINNVFMRVYYSNEKKPLEEIKENNLRKLLGDLDIYIEWDGYSEFSITGYETQSFVLGNHDLKNFFLELIDKYVYILIDVK